MNDTQVLLTRIAALRQRIDRRRGLADDAGPTVVMMEDKEDGNGRIWLLEREANEGAEENHLLDGSLRQLADTAQLSGENHILPRHLTARARRLVERGRALLERLRTLNDDPALSDASDPLTGLYRESAAMTESALRMVQAFPDAASAQLRLCAGLEATLASVAQRLATVAAVLARRRQEMSYVNTLADLLSNLHAGKSVHVHAFHALAEALLDDAQQSSPLRFFHENPSQPARFVACHSLVVAQVAARVVRHDPEFRGRPVEPVLAALVHDVGMLQVPTAILIHPGPLDDVRRRAIEGHCQAGADIVARAFSTAASLADATAGHHERLDGTGYPAGRRELQVPPLTRFLAVCDVYAALCTPRPHRPAKDMRTALTDTLLLAEQGALDRYHAERLLQLSFYPVGTVVELADGQVGAVVAVHQGRRDLITPARPVVALLTDAQSQPLPLPRYIDLAQCEGRSIVRTLPPVERRELLGRCYPEWV